MQDARQAGQPEFAAPTALGRVQAGLPRRSELGSPGFAEQGVQILAHHVAQQPLAGRIGVLHAPGGVGGQDQVVRALGELAVAGLLALQGREQA